ncbi:hypothetical protein IWQ60_006752 [Tieghemiomyces parasiticus]|uniref:Uncharacterized protein n=1 Tax=Tieghemiomyces parasiticus TaxID=78921 RepID=A0A9W8A6K2_9FUNG|nr:hypothetical protein IWQ60_006752 [Tieghemiomyces parasiticus]
MLHHAGLQAQVCLVTGTTSTEIDQFACELVIRAALDPSFLQRWRPAHHIVKGVGSQSTPCGPPRGQFGLPVAVSEMPEPAKRLIVFTWDRPVWHAAFRTTLAALELFNRPAYASRLSAVVVHYVPSVTALQAALMALTANTAAPPALILLHRFPDLVSKDEAATSVSALRTLAFLLDRLDQIRRRDTFLACQILLTGVQSTTDPAPSHAAGGYPAGAYLPENRYTVDRLVAMYGRDLV